MKTRKCAMCNGTGRLQDVYKDEICDNCDGTGVKKVTKNEWEGW